MVKYGDNVFKVQGEAFDTISKYIDDLNDGILEKMSKLHLFGGEQYESYKKSIGDLFEKLKIAEYLKYLVHVEIERFTYNQLYCLQLCNNVEKAVSFIQSQLFDIMRYMSISEEKELLLTGEDILSLLLLNECNELHRQYGYTIDFIDTTTLLIVTEGEKEKLKEKGIEIKKVSMYSEDKYSKAYKNKLYFTDLEEDYWYALVTEDNQEIIDSLYSGNW